MTIQHFLVPAALCGALLAAAFATQAQAAPVAVVNADFETDVHGPNTFDFGPPTGWDGYNTGAVTGESIGTLNPATSTYFTPGQWGGSNVAIAYSNVGGTANVEYGIRQTLTATLAANTLYTLTVDVGNIASGSSDLGSGPIFFDLDGFPGYRVELLAGTTQLAADVNGLHSGGNTIAEGEFETATVVFNSTGVDSGLLGQNLVIGLVNLNVPDPVDIGANREVDFDNVALDASAVPEPGSLVLVVLGLAALLLPGRRYRRSLCE